jgi:hypothetical protein
MNEETPLRKCHDIAETLQYCLEGLNEVDRAFVTMDCKLLNLLNSLDPLLIQLQTVRRVRPVMPAHRLYSRDKVSWLLFLRLRLLAFSMFFFFVHSVVALGSVLCKFWSSMHIMNPSYSFPDPSHIRVLHRVTVRDRRGQEEQAGARNTLIT